MQLKDQIKTYSLSEMEEYCKENIRKYNVEPIICEAFFEGIIRADIAFIYLRIAQMKENAEKITGRQIAKEVGVSPSVIVKYKQEDRLLGVTQRIYVQLLLKSHPKDMLNIWEKINFNQALADYVNNCRRIQVRINDNNVVRKGDYILDNEVTKDVCRKIYREMVHERIKNTRYINDDTDWIFSADIIKRKGETNIEIKWVTVGEERETTIKYIKEHIVHEMVYKIQNIIGGILSVKGSSSKIYLRRSSKRKLRLAMEYLSLTNDKVFLL